MVHPTELLRTDSNNGRIEFSAPLNVVNNNPIDCGINELPCLNKLFNLERFAKPVYFVSVLSLIGFLQGVVIHYVRGTSKLWGQHYNLSQETVDWLVYADEVFIGFLALPVAYWGFRINRPQWIGALTMFLSVGCLLLIIPEIYHQHIPSGTNHTTDSQLCVITHEQYKHIEEREVNYIAIVILCVFQGLFAMASISYVSHGITYVDDNISILNSSGYIGLILGVRELGKQIGTYASWIPLFFQLHESFVSVVWIGLFCLQGMAGLIISMFPKHFPSVIIDQGAASLLSLAAGNEDNITEEHIVGQDSVSDGFFSSLCRNLRNKILIISILSGLFIRGAMVNLAVFEKIYDQSRFLIRTRRDLSGYNDPPMLQFTTNLLKQPLVAIFAVTSGMFIAQKKPNPRSLVIWNIVIYSLVTLFFASTAFLNCDQKIENELDDVIVTPYCSADCGCSTNSVFEPVCLSDKTYFSPCYAGCTEERMVNRNQKIFRNCLCSPSYEDMDASEGSCDIENCTFLWALSQVNIILASGILSSTLVINMVINMRCVLPQDKGMALGLEIAFISIIPYLPIKTIYGLVAENYCDYLGEHRCLFYSKYLGLFISTASVILMVMSTIFAVILLFVVSKIELYGPQSDHDIVAMENIVDNNNSNMTSTRNEVAPNGENINLLQPPNENEPHLEERKQMSKNNPAVPEQTYRCSGTTESSHPSLEELEEVGDDHDSYDESTSSSYRDAVAVPQTSPKSKHQTITRKTSNEQLVTDF